MLGGISGGLLELLAHNVLPAFQGLHVGVLGASGAVMAILSAIAFYNPNLKIPFFGFFEIRIIFIALLFWLIDLLNLSNGTNDQIAHFAHFGGAIFGFFAIRNITSSNNVLNFTASMWDRIKNFFKLNKNHKKGRAKSFKKDEDYAFEKTKKQEKTDLILDKISKSGYESLTKEEKDFLFNQSKNI